MARGVADVRDTAIILRVGTRSSRLVTFAKYPMSLGISLNRDTQRADPTDPTPPLILSVDALIKRERLSGTRLVESST